MKYRNLTMFLLVALVVFVLAGCGYVRAGEPVPTGTAQISCEDAFRIALDHAGVAEADVLNRDVHMEREDGVQEYDIEFRTQTHEYEYEIHAETGQILSWDKDLDD